MRVSIAFVCIMLGLSAAAPVSAQVLRDGMRAMGAATVIKKTQVGTGKDVKIELVFEFKNTGTKTFDSV